MYVLTARWQEPCRGNALWVCDITEDETKTVNEIIAWLNKHGGQDIGGALCEFELFPNQTKGPADLTGLKAVVDEMKLNSRYNETDIPGDFYSGVTCPYFI